MMHADAADEQLLELRPDAVGQVILVGRQLRVNLDLLCVAEDRQPLELLGHLPALVAVEAEHQGGHPARASSSLTISASCSVSSLSPTQMNSSGTRRSFHWTRATSRPCSTRSQRANSYGLPTVADSSSTRTLGGSSASDSSQTMPRSGSLKLWNSSMTTPATSLKSDWPGSGERGG